MCPYCVSDTIKDGGFSLNKQVKKDPTLKVFIYIIQWNIFRKFQHRKYSVTETKKGKDFLGSWEKKNLTQELL